MKKRFTSLALALTVAVSMAISAAAAGNVEIPSNNGMSPYTEYMILDAEQKGKITLGEDLCDQNQQKYLAGQYDLLEVKPGVVLDLSGCYYAVFFTLDLVDGTLRESSADIADDGFLYTIAEDEGPWWVDGSNLAIFQEGYYLVAAWQYDPMAKSAEDTTGLARVIHVTAAPGASEVPAESEKPVETKEQPSVWAVELVNEAIEKGIVPEIFQTKYTQNTTRAEFCALAVQVYETITGTEVEGRVTFTDTQDVNVEKAAALGVVSGIGDGKFGPENELTREQAAVMLSQLADALNMPLAQGEADFADRNEISGWAAKFVGGIQKAGIMNGVGDNRFAPQDKYTHEQSIITALKLFNLK